MRADKDYLLYGETIILCFAVKIKWSAQQLRIRASERAPNLLFVMLQNAKYTMQNVHLPLL